MNHTKTKVIKIVALFAISILSTSTLASPSVEGYVIKWTEEGWHQVQVQSTYESVCNGGRQCTVAAGVYTVINHGTGQRYMDIAVPNLDSSFGNLPMAPVQSTGQLISYAEGDDGDYQLGVTSAGQRFNDNHDGTFDDTLTGLTWLGDRSCIPIYTWPVSIEFANNLSASSGECPSLSDGSEAGDWRVPNIKELLSLMNYSVVFPAWEPGIPFSGDWLENPISGTFWSSTSFQASTPNTNAYTLNTGVALMQVTGKTQRSEYVMPVRDTK